MAHEIIAGSFRDPSGYVFLKDGIIHRQINLSYRENYDHLMSSGLYQELSSSGLLIPHKEIDLKVGSQGAIYKTIIPEQLEFISYPYEWCFSQLKEAALLILKIEKIALRFGMSLKDSSAYNVQFEKGKSLLIDTLSFQKYHEGSPWVAYKQFCQHFIAPLALMAYIDMRLGQLLKNYIEGIPLDLARSMLPFSARFNVGLTLHLYLHASAQEYWQDKNVANRFKTRNFSRNSLLGLVDNLESLVKNLKYPPKLTKWASYYSERESYSAEALKHKQNLVSEFLDIIKPKNLWDIGANTGLFSRISANKGIFTVSFDADTICAEINYLCAVKDKETNILSLIIDLANPTPGIGWENQERFSFIERGPAEAAMALGIIHHLAISNNLPFYKIVNLMKNSCRWLIIEYIPKDDPMVKKLLSSREDIFSNYTAQAFENEFLNSFIIHKTVKIKDSQRTLYLMERK